MSLIWIEETCLWGSFEACLCSDTCKWLDSLVFLVKDEKPLFSSRSTVCLGCKRTTSGTVKNDRLYPNLRKKRTFREATTGFPAKWRLRNDRRNSILMTRHYPDLGCMCSWLAEANYQPIKSNTQINVETRHHYGILALVPQTSFCGEMVGGFAKCRLFSQVDCKTNTYLVPLTQCFENVPSLLVSWGLWKISNI